jgi:hypothetical protein
VHNNDDLNVTVTQEGLEFDIILQQAGKQYKGGKMGTELEGGFRKFRINVHSAESERIREK